MSGILKVLQVEDDESDAELVTRQLRKSGYEVEAERVDDAEAMRAALRRGNWSLVISDYQMPSFNAAQALRIHQESGLDIPFLVVSGTIGEEVAVAMMKAGAHDYLMKDNLTRLGSAVERELRDAVTRAERQQTLERLKESEAQLALALGSTGMGIFDHRPASGAFFLCRQARLHMNLSTTGEVTLADFTAAIHPEDRLRIERALEVAFQRDGNGHFGEEYRLDERGAEGKPARNKQERWASAWGKVSRDGANGTARFAGMVRDISERKSSERELQFRLDLIARITEQSTDCIMLSDTDGTMRFINPECIRLFGYTLEEYAGKTPHELLHHHYPDGTVYPPEDCRLTQMLSGEGVIRDYEEVMFHKNGSMVNVSVSGAALDIDGTRIGTVLTFRDITERKRTERALRRSDERFRRVFEAGIIGIMICDNAHILEANDHFLRILGYSRDEFFGAGRTWRSITAADHISQSEAALATMAALGSCPAFEKEYIRKDGSTLPALFAGVELSRGGEPQYLCFVVDLTERKNLEHQFRQAQKLESVGQLAGGVAHDFNNLLTVIMGYSDMLLAQLDGEHPFRGAMEQILQAAMRASGLTRQLLTFSRRNAVIPKTLPLNELVHGMEKMLRRLIGEDIEVVLALGAETGLLHADPGLIEQVIMNLVVNARDAMPEGGWLKIETSRLKVAPGSDGPCPAMPPGPYVTLSVTDTGTGMTADVQSRLFEPFFTTKEQGKGTGLGLSTVYGIVKQSGGFITVQSVPGSGSTFRVMFPAVKDDGKHEESAPKTQAATGSETILLVEDEAGVRNYMVEILKAHGYLALEAESGAEALQMARWHWGPIDMLVTDVVLPGMKVDEMIQQFLESRAGTVVLRISGYPERECDYRDGTSYLQKPFQPVALLNRIRGLLDARAEVARGATG